MPFDRTHTTSYSTCIVYEMQQVICRNLPILSTTPAFIALVEETPVEFQDDLRLTDGQMDGNQTQDDSIYRAIRARTVKNLVKVAYFGETIVSRLREIKPSFPVQFCV